MVNPVLMEADRNTRRRALRDEQINRQSGKWGDWERVDVPPFSMGAGWTRMIKSAHRNKAFCVLDSPLPNGVRHLAVSSLSGIRPSFHEMQRIKDELAGEDATAVEIYPPKDEIVDGADMFHIWVMPASLPFGLYRDYWS